MISFLIRGEENVHIPEVASVERTGHPGQPKKLVDPVYLRDAMSANRRISRAKLARKFNMSVKTLKKRMEEADITREYSDISNNDLDDIIRKFRRTKPLLGINYAIAHVANLGIRVQDRRIRQSIQRTGGLSAALRHPHRIQRTQYRVPRPNALWHIDGHHKLILWGIVIHGVVDGYCRSVCFLCCIWASLKY
jgi:hypothetical protein